MNHKSFESSEVPLEMVKAKHESTAIYVEELEESMKLNLHNISRRLKKEDPCTIYKVFNSVRREHSQDYDPQTIAIGPYHRDNETLKQMELLKWAYLQEVINRNPENENTLRNYIKAVDEVKAVARSYYSEPIEMEDKAFVQMLVVDGVFLIDFLAKAYLGEDELNLEEAIWNLPLLRRDLLLLENQIPFPILQLLFDSSNELLVLPNSNTTLMNLAVSYVTRYSTNTLPEVAKPYPIRHLLHVYHASMHPSPRNRNQLTRSGSYIFVLRTKNFLNCLFYFVFYVLTGHKPWRWQPNGLVGNQNGTTRAIPTVSQLMEFGVTFKKKKGTNNFLDVSFDKEEGIMKIPILSLEESTISLLRNLIAFEQCCPKSGSHFTSYSLFMNKLIHKTADVSILKRHRIIDSKLAEDREVAEVLIDLGHGALLDFENHALLHVFKDVVEYCNVSHRKWRAELMPYYNYFKRPWAFFSLIVGVFLFVPTMVQTFYAVYAYYKPPPL